MANNEKQQIDDNVQDAELVSVKHAGQPRHQLLWLALLAVLVLSALASGWLYQRLQQAGDQWQQQLAMLKQDEQALQADLQQNTQQLLALQQSQQQLAQQVDELSQQQQYSSAELMTTWTLHEVGYLLNIANQRALLAQDVAGAKKALRLADKQLETLSDYRLHPLRALIAEEIMALEALAGIDIAGMALQLQTAANRVETLRVAKGPEVAVASAPQAEQPDAAGWRQAVDDVWQQLRSLVVIRHDQSGEAAVLVPEQRYFLYQNLRLQLESARLALMRADAAAYRHSLQAAIGWLQRYFTGDERDAMLNTLQTLQDTDIAITIPDISASLTWLEGYQQ